MNVIISLFVILQVEAEIEKGTSDMNDRSEEDEMKWRRTHENGENVRYLFDLKTLKSFHSIRDGKVKADGLAFSQGQR